MLSSTGWRPSALAATTAVGRMTHASTSVPSFDTAVNRSGVATACAAWNCSAKDVSRRSSPSTIANRSAMSVAVDAANASVPPLASRPTTWRSPPITCSAVASSRERSYGTVPVGRRAGVRGVDLLGEGREPPFLAVHDREQVGDVGGGRRRERERPAVGVETDHLAVAANHLLGGAVEPGAVDGNVAGLVHLE